MRRLKWFGFVLLVATGCGETQQQFGGPPGGSGGAAGSGGSAGSAGTGGAEAGAGGDAPGGTAGVGIEPSHPVSDFEWLNPMPHGDGFRAVAARGDSNLWVAGRGEVVRWDGASWTTFHPSQADDLYHGLWVRGSGDVWAIGTRLTWPVNTDQPEEAALLTHFDGATWQADARYGARTFTAITGTATLGVAALDGGDVLLNDGSGWQLEATPTAHELRALWVASDDNVWAVGDAGTLLQRTSSGWKQAPVAGSESASDHHYLAVWGASPGDVWAAYETAPLDGGATADDAAEIGFVHFDGTRWTTLQTAAADCRQELPGLAVGAEPHPTAVRGEWQSRRGALMAGRSGGEIVASVGNGRCLWKYDGQTWQVLAEGFQWSNGSLGMTLPLGDIPSVAATPTSIWIAGSAGQLKSFDASVDFPLPAPTAESQSFDNPGLKETFPARRRRNLHVGIDEGEIVSAFDGVASRWTANGWKELLGSSGGARPSDSGSVTDVTSDGQGGVWAVGGEGIGWDKPFAYHLTDGSWVRVAVEEARPEDSWGIEYYPDAFVMQDGSVWLHTQEYLRIRTDDEFKIVFSVFDLEGDVGLSQAAGDLSDDTWFAASNTLYQGPSAADWHAFVHVYQLEGDQPREVYQQELGERTSMTIPPVVAVPTAGSPWVFVTADTQGVKEGSVLKLRDGVWDTSEAPVDVISAYARAENDVYVLTISKLLYHFDGTAWRVVFTADNLGDLAGDGEHLVLVGTLGATVRGTLPLLPPK